MTHGSGKTFVLVHGAWHGGWCWARVADGLRARGHRVTTPTQTGLGERAHLLSREIDLSLFSADIVHHLRYEDLTDVVLVGHSFGGNAITGAADAAPERIARLVYLDAMLLDGGETPFGLLPPEVVEARLLAAERSSGGLSLPPPAPEAFGVTDPADAAWLTPKLTPHPLRTFQSALTLRGAPGAGLPVEYITCVEPLYAPLEASRRRARGRGWTTRDIRAGHDAMVTAPAALVEMLCAPA